MTAYTDTINLTQVSTAQLLLWLERLNMVRDTHEPLVLLDAGFTIPAAIARLEKEIMKRSLARVYSRRIYKPLTVKS